MDNHSMHSTVPLRGPASDFESRQDQQISYMKTTLLITFALIPMVLFSQPALNDKLTPAALPEPLLPKIKSFGEFTLPEIEAYKIRLVNPLPVDKAEKDKLKPYQHTEHQLGYIPFVPTQNTEQNLVPASSITSDKTLKRIFIRLDHIRVFDYPGTGLHRILFQFEANNKIVDAEGVNEKVTFSQLYDAQEGQGTGVAGYPIFNGLNVGNGGVAFKCATINVENKNDKDALNFMKSSLFSDGLSLLTKANPVIAPFTGIVTGMSEMILKRNENVKVQDFYLGLDTNDGAAFGARLAEGNYIVVQARTDTFSWSDWQFDAKDRKIVSVNNPMKYLPYNYVCFRVSKYE